MTTRRIVAALLVLTACGGSSVATTSQSSPPSTTVTSTSVAVTTRGPSSTTATTTPTTTSTSVAPTTISLVPPEIPDGGTLCDLYRAPVEIGQIDDVRLVEVSGIAASRAHQGVVWAVNDSGDGPIVYAVTAEGQTIASITLNATFPIDWEDLDLGPGPGGVDHLYVGDVGDNLGFRPWISVFRLAEPDPFAGDADADATEIELVYPDVEATDAEAIAVDPVTGDLLVIPKSRNRPVGVYRATSDTLEGRTTLERIATLDLGAEITGAAFGPSGDRLVLRGYKTIWIWPRSTLDLAELFAEAPCEAPSPTERQGESITVLSDGGLVTVSEGGRPPVNLVPLDD